MLFDCPYCKAKYQFNPTGNEVRSRIDQTFYHSWVRQHCSGKVVTKRPYFHIWSSAELFPLIRIKPKIRIEKLPENIKNDYLESLENYSCGGYTSSVIMSRCVIQQACLDKGAKKKNLFDQIEELDIDENLKKLGHKLRFWGNQGAHPDILLGEKIEEKDAKVAIDFTEKFLQYVYVIPKEIEEIEGQFNRKKNKNNYDRRFTQKMVA